MKWIFEGRVYSSLEELSGKTMSEGNVPQPVFSEQEIINYITYCNRKNKGDCIRPAVYFQQPYIQKFDLSMFHVKYSEKVDVGEGAESESEL